MIRRYAEKLSKEASLLPYVPAYVFREISYYHFAAGDHEAGAGMSWNCFEQLGKRVRTHTAFLEKVKDQRLGVEIEETRKDIERVAKELNEEMNKQVVCLDLMQTHGKEIAEALRNTRKTAYVQRLIEQVRDCLSNTSKTERNAFVEKELLKLDDYIRRLKQKLNAKECVEEIDALKGHKFALGVGEPVLEKSVGVDSALFEKELRNSLSKQLGQGKNKETEALADYFTAHPHHLLHAFYLAEQTEKAK